MMPLSSMKTMPASLQLTLDGDGDTWQMGMGTPPVTDTVTIVS